MADDPISKYLLGGSYGEFRIGLSMVMSDKGIPLWITGELSAL